MQRPPHATDQGHVAIFDACAAISIRPGKRSEMLLNLEVDEVCACIVSAASKPHRHSSTNASHEFSDGCILMQGEHQAMPSSVPNPFMACCDGLQDVVDRREDKSQPN